MQIHVKARSAELRLFPVRRDASYMVVFPQVLKQKKVESVSLKHKESVGYELSLFTCLEWPEEVLFLLYFKCKSAVHYRH